MERITALHASQQHGTLQELLSIAQDLTASLAAEDRYARLLAALRRMIPCDAACLLRLEEGDELRPVAGHGLAPEALARRYHRGEEPRLDVILGSHEPVHFPDDSPLPDPFDGMLDVDKGGQLHVHACLGCRLTCGDEVVGALTADALDARAFDGLDLTLVAMLGALAGAALRTSALVDTLEAQASHQEQVARELQRSASVSRGMEIIGTSPPVVRMRRDIEVAAGSDLPVLITGETGVGKELVARAVHAGSPRSEEALIQVNCAALPDSLAESELFGHVRGAFTGATRDRAGKFEIADGGTLFLDEIGELPAALQPKLLRVLQDGEVQRVGSDRALRVDVRILAATNRDLEAAVRKGRFRADLFHRLAVYPIHVPPLRDRREDIAMLAAHFIDRARQRLGVSRVRLDEEAREALRAADWPGNVRELRNVISRGVLRAAAGRDTSAGVQVTLEQLDVRPTLETAPAPETKVGEEASRSRSLRDRVELFRRQEILAAVRRNGGNWAAAARELEMHRSNLHNMARRLGLI
jgi:anaerobic nitric oxide reductase transcription regulator